MLVYYPNRSTFENYYRPMEWLAASRRHAGAHTSCPVVMADGSAPPHLRGESYYWTTPSGRTVVHHPRAYKWRTGYWPSTLYVEVGRDWRPARTRRDMELGVP